MVWNTIPGHQSLILLIMNKLFTQSFFHRLAYYLIGLVIGIFILQRIYKAKNAQFQYGPNARTLTSIKNRPHFEYSQEALTFMKEHELDSTFVLRMLAYGKVKFTQENRGKAPCHTYRILPTGSVKPYQIMVKRCDSVATLLKVEEYQVNQK